MALERLVPLYEGQRGETLCYRHRAPNPESVPGCARLGFPTKLSDARKRAEATRSLSPPLPMPNKELLKAQNARLFRNLLQLPASHELG